MDKFDEKAFSHPNFDKGMNPVRQLFMAQVDPRRSPNGFTLQMGAGYQVEVNLETLQANVPGVKDSVPFAFHRRIHDEKKSELIKVPSQQKADQVVERRQHNTIQFQIDC